MGRLYKTAAWQRARQQALHDGGWQCGRCGVSLVGKGKGAQVHHRKALKKAPALALEPLNLQPLCAACHGRTEVDERYRCFDLRNRPVFAPPRCRVVLVCGPPAAGKTTYARQHMQAGDELIDLDLILQDMGHGRERSFAAVGHALDERNKRFAALARMPKHCTAWVVLTAPSTMLRAWWCAALAVEPERVVLLVPTREVLRARIAADPDRRHVVEDHFALVDQWFERERANDPGFINSGCDVSGAPLDPLHPWNANRGGHEEKPDQ